MPRPAAGVNRRAFQVAAGCLLVRHGSKHDWYQNPKSGMAQPVPRRREINERLARHILKKMDS